jgi:hypothetical protein
MKYLTLFSLTFVLFSCDPKEKIVTPDPSINPPEWIRGSWVHTDTANFSEKLIISDDDIIFERFLSTGKTAVSYMDSCKTYKLSVEEKIKNNTYYSVEFINDSKEINIIYLAKIAAGEIRLINQTSPTPKTFAKEN